MSAALRASPDGIGIAAPQIGVSKRVFLVSEEAKFMERREREEGRAWRYFVYINPAITNFSKQKVDEVEGCLSVPREYGITPRPEKVAVEAYDENGKKFTQGAAKFYARVLQHEMDHLNGVLFIDKATKMVPPKDHAKEEAV
jgi:peptide deformylase